MRDVSIRPQSPSGRHEPARPAGVRPQPAPPVAEALLRVQRSAGNTAATLLIQRNWTQDHSDEVARQMNGSDWNRDGGPWWLLNGHNPEGLVAILRRMGAAARGRLAAHPVDGARYDKPRLDLAMTLAARSTTSAGQVSGMDAIRNAIAKKITFADCWATLLRMSSVTRIALYRQMTGAERQELLENVDAAPTREQPRLEGELAGLVGPKAEDLLLEFTPDAGEITEIINGSPRRQPMGEIRVLLKGAPVMSVPARGGPWQPHPDPDNPGHTFNPTTSGDHTLSSGRAIVTTSWSFSQLANGTPIRDTGSDIEFQRGGKWTSVQKLSEPLDRQEILKLSTEALITRDLRQNKLTPVQAENERRMLTNTGRVRPLPPEWMINDFGKEGFRIDGTGGDIIHTTPTTDDANATLVPGDLEFSHGCVHILAQDRQRLIEKGFLRGGVRIRVHPYDPTRINQWGPPP